MAADHNTSGIGPYAMTIDHASAEKLVATLTALINDTMGVCFDAGDQAIAMVQARDTITALLAEARERERMLAEADWAHFVTLNAGEPVDKRRLIHAHMDALTRHRTPPIRREGQGMIPMSKTEEWKEDCYHWRGRLLNGDFAHWCNEWDGLPVDETTPEWPCGCFGEVSAKAEKDKSDG